MGVRNSSMKIERYSTEIGNSTIDTGLTSVHAGKHSMGARIYSMKIGKQTIEIDEAKNTVAVLKPKLTLNEMLLRLTFFKRNS